MRVLVLWADDVSANLGVRVLGAGTSALARQAFPNAEITYLNYGLDTAPMRVGSWRALVREAVTGKNRLRQWLQTFDLVIDTRSGDSFTDIYGIPRLVTMNLVAEFVHAARVPLVMGPQTLGPFDTTRGRILGGLAARRAHVVMARDSASLEFGRTLAVTPERTSDVVFALPAPHPVASRDVLVNVSGLLWNDNPHVSSHRYRELVTEVSRSILSQGREVVLLAHVLNNPTIDNDVPAVRDLARLLPGKVEVLIPANLEELRSAVASAQLVIGARMHARLNAISCGTPAIPLAYSRKFAPLLADLGWTAVVEVNSARDPAASTLEFVADSGLTAMAVGAKARGVTALGSAVEVLRRCVRGQVGDV